MFRIANWFESRLGRNDGNPLYVQACLKRMQHYGNGVAGRPMDVSGRSWFSTTQEDPLAQAATKLFFENHRETIAVDHMYPTGDNKIFGKFDLNLHIDWGEDGLRGILPYTPDLTPNPFAYWASDTHILTPTTDSYDYRLETAKRADHVFVAQKVGVERMKADGISNPIWLPHAFEPQAYPLLQTASKKYDVCFVGHINASNRANALDRLFREFPNFYYGQQLFEKAAEKYSESKVCFNISMTDDINMRTFEVMGTGSFLLTNWIPTIEELFEDGKHLVLYRSEEEMIDKARYYLDHDDEREKIAQAGYEEVITKHTIQHRVNVILEEAMKGKIYADKQQEVTHAGI